jgi:DNA-binding transcriptional MocR family regulator
VTWAPRTLRPDAPLYLALADRIAEDVAVGRLAPGERLPTHRELAALLGIDLTTVTRGYAEARRRGLLTGRVGRGTFVSVAARSGSGTGVRAATGVTDLSLNVSPTLDPDLPAEALARALTAIAKDVHLGALLAYQDNAGMQMHRAAGAAWVGRRMAGIDADRVVLTNGAQHAIMVLLSTLLSRGDVVMTERLTYPGFRGVAEYLGLRVLGLDLDDEGITVESFRRACRAGATLLYTTPTLQNPTTITMSAARRAALAKVARTHGVRIIEDDVYGVLADRAPAPLSTHTPELSYFVASLTKAVAGGLRIGYVTCPTSADAERIAAGVRVTTWMAPPLMAHIASDWVRSGVAREVLTANRNEAARRQALASRHLGAWDWRGHRFAYHGWLELPDGWTSGDFVEQARRRGVAVTPADAFAVDASVARPAVRLSVTGTRDVETLESALATVVGLLELGPRAASRHM